MLEPHAEHQIAEDLGVPVSNDPTTDWLVLLRSLLKWTAYCDIKVGTRGVQRLKQWLNLAQRHGDFVGFDELKRIETVEEFFASLQSELEKAA